MKPKFQPDTEADPEPSEQQMVDPEAYDASEQRFAASLEAKPRFVVEAGPDRQVSALEDRVREPENAGPEVPLATSAVRSEPAGAQPPDSDVWRQELASRVSRYRSRRRQPPPRYPSLQLRFEPSDLHEDSNRHGVEGAEIQPASRLAVATEVSPAIPLPSTGSHSVDAPGKVIEFPRPQVPAPVWDELAEPLLDRPRILEVPEVLPPPPALGGILIETTEAPASQRRPGFEMPLQGASKGRRLAAAAFDILLVLAAFAAFAYTFFRMTSTVPSIRQALGISAALVVVFWVGYQYLLLVCTGATPGLKVAGLRLIRFNGRPVPRSLRRWRVATSLLSGFSLALGYAWCFFDEDQLCWHDRITRTYLALQPGSGHD